MDRRWMTALLVASCWSVAACDQKEAKLSADANGPASLGAPEPARFGARAEPVWQAGDEPKGAWALLQSASAAPSSLVDTAGDQTGRKIFDGVKISSLGEPAAPPISSAGGAPIASRPTGKTLVIANRQMAIDTDGLIKDPAARSRVVARDPWHRNGTALTYASGRALDSTIVPYISLPMDFNGAKMGDLALVEYNGRKVWAVCGDRGPAGKFGEASPVVAQALGIDPDGTSGGVSSGVTYTLYPGSGKGRPRSQTELLGFISAGAGGQDSFQMASAR